MTNRSGYNKTIDLKINKDTPKFVCTDIVDKKRNTILKLSSTSKFAKTKRPSLAHKREEEAKYFFNQFNDIYSPQNNFNLKKYAL